jgi:hypothetical protein
MWPVLWYLSFVAITLLGFRVLVFLWPYPLLLCLQKWIPESLEAFIGAWFVGLGLVFGVGLLAQRIARFRRLDAVAAAVFSLFLWPLPLAVVELTAWAVAASLGWPYGE